MSSLTTTQRNRRDAIALAHLDLADQIATSFSRRFRSLLDPDDLKQVAREALLRAASRCRSSTPPAPYLRRCITGALQHHLRDHARLVRISRRAHESRRWPLIHLSLDQHHPSTDGTWLDQLHAQHSLSTHARTGSTDSSDCDVALLQSCIAQLPAPQAAALRLTLLQGHSIRSAARLLGISATALHRHRHSAIHTLRHHFRIQHAA
jgi:RNA polymerase sigma-B factor